jgi:hypothetical protein
MRSTSSSSLQFGVICAALLTTAACGADDGQQDSVETDVQVYPDLWSPSDASVDDASDVADVGDDVGVPSDTGTMDTSVPSDAGPGIEASFDRSWPDDPSLAPRFADCLYASPLVFDRDGVDELIVTGADVIVGMSPVTGEVLWEVDLPEPAGRRALAAATPVLIGERLVVGFQVHATDVTGNALDEGVPGIGAADSRDGHYVAVVNLGTRSLDPDFPVVRLDATVPGNDGDVTFRANTQFGRSDLKWAGTGEGRLGRVYVTFGNVRDIQPWHGWAFELDLDAWQASEEDAINAVYVTTPESDCGREGVSGSTQRICGGGLWAPSGPLIVEHDDSYSVILAPGNGQLDLARNDWANTLLRLEPELQFAHGCDPEACREFDVDEPARACVESCSNVFIPRPLPGEDAPRPASGICDDLPFFECWQQLDYIGGSTPTYLEVGDERLLAYPTKDGHMYLVDFDHLGEMHDRMQLVEYCGTTDDACRWSWAGMIVTEPAVAGTDEEPVLIVPTFMPDSTHPAGVVAVAVIESDAGPRLERRWEYPNFSSPEAITSFRVHPSRAVVEQFGDREVVLLVEPSIGSSPGRIMALDASNGEQLASIPLVGRGYRFMRPLVVGDTVYINSCGSDQGPGTIEAYAFQPGE